MFASVEYGFSGVTGYRDPRGLGVGDAVGTALQVPLAPWGDHLDVRLQGVGRQLEPHLVVALPGGPVGDRICTGLDRRTNETLRDDMGRASDVPRR